jgi:hypothetical protein
MGFCTVQKWFRLVVLSVGRRGHGTIRGPWFDHPLSAVRGLGVIHHHRIRLRHAHSSCPCFRRASAPRCRTLRHRTLGIRHLNPIHGLVFSVSRCIAQDEIVWSRRRESQSDEPVRRRHLCVRGNFDRTFERGAGVADVGGRLRGSKNNAKRISPPARRVSIPSFVGYLTS